MQIAICQVRLSEFNEVTLNDVTPAEAIILQHVHGRNAGGPVITSLSVVTDAKRSPTDEASRLRQKYGQEVVERLFPGVMPALPEDFPGKSLEEPAPPPPPQPSINRRK